MPASSSSDLCGETISSRRGFLASLWSLVTLLTLVAFVVALVFSHSRYKYADDEEYYYYQNNAEEQDMGGAEEYERTAEIAVTSRAMAFAALWTAVLAALLSIFGTVVLGWQSPTGVYYTCCAPQVHRTTPLALGSFVGALLMFANLTLVCSVLFGEFEIRDYRDAEDRREGGAGGNNNNMNGNQDDFVVDRTSLAFSIMCMFLTVIYAAFAALTYNYSSDVLEEMLMDYHQSDKHSHHAELQMSSPRPTSQFVGGYHNDGYIGERFDVVRRTPSGFVAPQTGAMT